MYFVLFTGTFVSMGQIPSIATMAKNVNTVVKIELISDHPKQHLALMNFRNSGQVVSPETCLKA